LEPVVLRRSGRRFGETPPKPIAPMSLEQLPRFVD